MINLSLGGPNSWPEDPSSVVADRISSRNVTGMLIWYTCLQQHRLKVVYYSSGRGSRKRRIKWHLHDLLAKHGL